MVEAQRFSWIAFALFFLTYCVFGWLITPLVFRWQEWFLVTFSLSEAIAQYLGWASAALLVIAIKLILTSPIRIIRQLFSSWLQSDIKALTSILAWAFAAVLIVCWLDEFAHLLVLVSATLLGHLELQNNGYKGWQIFFILTSIALLAFAIGITLHSLHLPLKDLATLTSTIF